MTFLLNHQSKYLGCSRGQEVCFEMCCQASALLPLFHFLLSRTVLYAHFSSKSEITKRSSATTMLSCQMSRWIRWYEPCTCFSPWEWGGLSLNPSKWVISGQVLRFGATVRKQFSVLVFELLMCSSTANLAQVLFTGHPRDGWHFCSAIWAR